MTFYETLTEAVNEFTQHGFQSEEQLAEWMRKIREAAERDLVDPRVLENELAANFKDVFDKMITRGGILRYHDGVPAWRLKQLAPRLRPELDRRLMANASLIKLNRTRAVEQTLQRFSGWSTSIPAGGSRAVDKHEVKSSIRKSLAQLPFEERRVAIDQGLKFISDLNDIIAHDNGALAAEWHSHFRQHGYDARERHKEFDGHLFVVRDNWAMRKGLMKLNSAKYIDEIEKPGQLICCRCSYRWIYNLRSLPAEMLTVKGKAELARIRGVISGSKFTAT